MNRSTEREVGRGVGVWHSVIFRPCLPVYGVKVIGRRDRGGWGIVCVSGCVTQKMFTILLVYLLIYCMYLLLLYLSLGLKISERGKFVPFWLCYSFWSRVVSRTTGWGFPSVGLCKTISLFFVTQRTTSFFDVSLLLYSPFSKIDWFLFLR